MKIEPRIGWLVHYGYLDLSSSHGRTLCRAAVIVAVNKDKSVNLSVFADGLNDIKVANLNLDHPFVPLWVKGARYGEQPGEWHEIH